MTNAEKTWQGEWSHRYKEVCYGSVQVEHNAILNGPQHGGKALEAQLSQLGHILQQWCHSFEVVSLQHFDDAACLCDGAQHRADLLLHHLHKLTI